MAVLCRKARNLSLRKADILKAAERIFALRGYDKATIQDIAREAQYAPGTLYLYFKNKWAIYFSLFERNMEELLALIKKEMASLADAREKLEIFLEKEAEFFKKNQDFFRIFVSVNKVSRVAVDYKIVNSHKFIEYSNLTCRLIKMAQQGGLIRCDLDPRQLGGILHSISTSSITGWLLKERQREPKDSKEAARFILDVFLNGVGQKSK